MALHRENRLVFAAVFLILGVTPAAARAVEGAALPPIAFPRDPAVVDARRDLGAKGDGVADDTEALQKGLDASCGIGGGPTKVLFLPAGTYRVTRTLVVKSAIGPWMYGASRDGVVIRLADGAKDCNSVLRTHPNEKGDTSSDWFMRNLRHFTIDAGNNPGVDGIRYYATNTGILQNVRVIGNGKVGINSSFLGQSGPNMIQDAVVEGFETGLVSSWVYGQTLSRVTVRNCRKVGVAVQANAVAVEDLVVENTPVGLSCEVPNDWTHWGGVVALVGGRFTGGGANGAAIVNQSVLYARNVRTQGYKTAIESSTPGGSVAGPHVAEYTSHEPKHLFDAPARALALPIKPEPRLAWETDPDKWVCVNDHGAVAGDERDDTAAIQKAIDAAASAGKTTVYLRGVGGPDPNGYTLEGEVRVHGSVRHVLGLGFGRILAGKNGRLVVGDDAAPVVKFQNIDSFGGPAPTLVNRSASTMVVESCGVTIVGEGTGDIFATDCPAHVRLRRPGQKMWARHLNVEGDVKEGLVNNAGGDLWILGTKSENRGLRYRVSNGGRMEIFGAFQYTNMPIDEKDTRALFEIDNAAGCVMGLREICHNGQPYVVKMRERRGSQTRTLTAETEGGWPGWALYSGWSEKGAKPQSSP